MFSRQYLTSLYDQPVTSLGTNEVHLWLVDLVRPHIAAADFCSHLSESELSRYRQIRSDHDRLRFAASHSILRIIIGIYLRIAPSDVRYVTNSFGKPMLANGAGLTGFFFNLSHSADRIALVFARSALVGVDIEKLDSAIDYSGIARDFFSHHEAQAILSCPPSEQIGAFFRCWTRKEAYIKAIGMGLSVPLTSFVVSVDDSPGPFLVRESGDLRPKLGWSIVSLGMENGYYGALALDSPSFIVNKKCLSI